MLDSLKVLLKLLSTNILVAILSFSLTIYLASIIGPELYGKYAFSMILGLFCAQYVVFSTEATGRFLKNTMGDERAFNAVSFLRLIHFFVILIFSALLTFKYDFEIILGMIAVAIAGLNSSYIYEWKHEQAKYSVVFLIEKIIYISSAFVFLYFFDVKNIYFLFLIMLLVTLSSCYFQYNYIGVYKVSFNFSDVIFVFKNNYMMYLTALLTFVYGGYGRILIGEGYGMAMLGLFSAAWQMVFIITMFNSQIVRIWRGRIADSVFKKDSNDLLLNIKTYLVYCVVPVLIFSLILFFFSDLFFSMLFSDKYVDSAKMVKFLSPYFVIITLEFLSVMLWSSVSDRKINLILYAVFSIVTFIIMHIGVKFLTIYEFILIIPIMHGFCVFTSLVFFGYKLRNLNEK
ncbi:MULTISPECIES: lipopolysaccharide biosynthesis protein [unclassified Acinetobacter]|uniref:lipopolysaccharide biosynthesis protein n=1 Tax=unclassified Acinetobacter TaxID=196816 RepID=UPI0015D23D84|nr:MULTISPECIES: hypothetical protein [unclassified Acinetobacter]